MTGIHRPAGSLSKLTLQSARAVQEFSAYRVDVLGLSCRGAFQPNLTGRLFHLRHGNIPDASLRWLSSVLMLAVRRPHLVC